MHLTDDDLILRFYGETAPDEARRIEDHLRACASCRDAWSELEETLKMVDTAIVPEPPESFERVMWAKVSQQLPDRRRWTWRQLVPVLSLAALILAAIALGLQWRAAAPPEADGAAADASAGGRGPSTTERVLLTALDEHFEQTERLLVEVMNAPIAQDASFEFERVAADDLLASGRLYRLTAEQTGQRQFAQMLEDLEPVLVEVARRPERPDQHEIESLRSRIDDDALLFKVRALSVEIRERQQDIVTTNEGGI